MFPVYEYIGNKCVPAQESTTVWHCMMEGMAMGNTRKGYWRVAQFFMRRVATKENLKRVGEYWKNCTRVKN